MYNQLYISESANIIFQILFHYRLLQDNWMQLPVLYFVIYSTYSSVYILIPNSWFIPSFCFPYGNHNFVFYAFESVLWLS